jgi:hypothetical protein
MEDQPSPEAQLVIDDAAAVVAAVAEVNPDLAEAVASVIEEALALADPAASSADSAPAADVAVIA